MSESDSVLLAQKITLFVDDKTFLTDRIRSTLEHLRCETFEIANTIERAWEIIKQGDVEHIVCDWQMPPDLGGIQLLLDVRDRYPEIRCTLLTSFYHDLERNRELKQRVIEAGIPVLQKRDVSEKVIADLVGIELEPPSGEFEDDPDSWREEMNDQDIVLDQRLTIDRLSGDLEEKKRDIESLNGLLEARKKVISMFAADLVEDLKKIKVDGMGMIVGSSKIRTLEDIIREIEDLTPLGLELIELDREVNRQAR